MTKQTQDQQFSDIVGLYDIAEELIMEVDSVSVHYKQTLHDLVSALVEDVTEAADVLTESFTDIAESGNKPGRVNKARVESSLRKIFGSIEAYRERNEALKPRLLEQAVERTTRLVERLKERTGHIVAIFVQYVDISVDRVMHKSEFEELKRKEAEVAFQLHQLGKR